MDLGLKGRKAILAGANASMGLAVARILAGEGCDIALCGRTQGKVDGAVAELSALGVNAFGASVDVTDADAFPAWIEQATSQLGGCDIFISFVSVNPGADTVEGWNTVFNGDILPLVRGIQAALPSLEQSDAGSIVTISSTGAIEEFMGPQPYNALKAAIMNYSAALAQKHAPQGIRVNCVTPGPVFTPDGPWQYIKDNMADFHDSILQQIPFGRMGTGEEIGKAIAFIASPACRYMTGANVRIDGSMTKGVSF
ncbi:SDR family oxidoreductase [Sphingobium sp. CR2-8]|uniref:SDR family NAD(P)-dependent oxidoreductase n=1 Tax=Sphingobium sp. CR2-8 TaxID=1306534 RepID=UPI002DB70F24|nr:SDR family oxidoreductase [Sphingobium sp. CR2-8]MEC3910974.1 SDR family oxidoreductase [Sphingobium sp. CR2-8]